MYVIRSAEDGSVIGCTDKLVYIKRHPTNGSYVGASEADAEGIAYRSEPYALFGKEGVDAQAVVVNEDDAGHAIGTVTRAEAQNRADIDFIAMETGVELES